MEIYSFNLCNSNAPIMDQMLFFNNHVMMLMIMIIISILTSMIFNIKNYYYKIISNNNLLEMMWTMLPMTILILIAYPSLNLLYIMDEMYNPSMSIKIIGHQWFWSYEFIDILKKEIYSYMIPNKTIKKMNFRLMETDNQLSIPFKSKIRLLFSSYDVIHSWTIQSIGIKMDTIPGRLNQAILMVNYPKIMFGQCSEICGMNHSFMPSSMESMSMNKFFKWINLTL